MSIGPLMRAGAATAGTVFCLTVSGAAQAPAELTFCVRAESPTTSRVGISPEVEVAVARALAAELGAGALFVRLGPHDMEPEQALLSGRCQAAPGVIDDPSLITGDRLPAGISLTDPYYAAGYVLISRGDVRPVRTLDELGEARIGVEKESIVAFTLRQRGRRVHVLPNAAAVVRAVAERRLDFGYLWGPLAAGQIQDRDAVVVIEQFVPADRWNVTIAVRSEAGELRHGLNRAIHRSLEHGAIARLLEADDVPFLAPNAVSREPIHAQSSTPP